MVRPVAKAIIVTLPAGRGNRGFTLIELILVLMLLGLSSLVVLPNIGKVLQDREVRRSALGLAAVLRNLRNRALFEGSAQQLVIHLAENDYQASPHLTVRLPNDVQFTTVLGGVPLDGNARQFTFFPNGTSHGGLIALAGGRDTDSYSIRMEALTGRIEVRRGGRS